MTNHEYLTKIIQSQTLGPDSDELKALRTGRSDIETRLRAAFGSSPTIRYGGSQAKGTLVKESYDLDLLCYFPRDEADAGETLAQIYESVRGELSKHYVVEPKTSALRVRGTDHADFQVDVVPGRFIEEGSYDTFLYCSSREKCRLKTNIETHIDHVRDSGVTDAIKLMKIWRTRNGIQLKTFVLELIVIDTLAGSTAPLDEQLRTILERLRDDSGGMSVKDPANPEGNDLTDAWNASVRATAAAVAASSLSIADAAGWEAVFGRLPAADQEPVIDALRRAAQVSSSRSKPWCR